MAADAKTELLATAKARLKRCRDEEHDLREESRKDFRFYKGDQWPADIKNIRQKQGALAVCMTINLCKPAVKQITNDQRQNRGAIKVSPVDSGADPDTAQVLQGIIRHIEYDSNADVAYDTAFQHAVIGGFGYMQVAAEYEDPRSFYQCLKVRRFRNAFNVYMDSDSTEPDGSDAKYAFVMQPMSKEEYKAEYPKSEMVSLDEAETREMRASGWMDGDDIIVAGYYYTESEKDTAYLLPDGSTVLLSEVTQEPQDAVATREVETQRVKWCKLNGKEILEETEWLGRYIPIVKVIGDELELDGELILEGLIRQAQDPQRMVNYWESKQTEAIALAPKAPFLIAEGQIEGHESEFKNANTQNLAALVYKAQDIAGHLVPPPARNVAEPAIAAITVAGQSARENFKDVTQLHQASYGAESNEKSGKAILARQQQGQTGNFHFVDNLTRSRRHLGRILIDLIPKIYNEPGRVLRIIGEDDSQDSVKVGQRQEGVKGIYDPSVGRYDVIVETGPSYATKRKEAVESMLNMVSTAPQLLNVMGDLIVKNMDWPGNQEMAERMKAMLPPQIQQAEDGKQPIPPQVQAQLDQMGQLLDQMTKELNAKNDLIEKETLKLESQERIAQAQLQVKKLDIQARMMETNVKLDSQEAIAALKADVEALKAKVQVNIAEQAQEAAAAAQTM